MKTWVIVILVIMGVFMLVIGGCVAFGVIIYRIVSNPTAIGITDAVQADNIEYCGTITKLQGYSSRNECYLTFALSKNDSGLCYEVSEADGIMGRWVCFSLLASKLRNESLCELIIPVQGVLILEGTSTRDNCYMRLVKKTMNASYCKGFSTESDRVSCVIGVPLAKAIID